MIDALITNLWVMQCHHIEVSQIFEWFSRQSMHKFHAEAKTRYEPLSDQYIKNLYNKMLQVKNTTS